MIEYDGINYGGWQRQNNALTIQGALENAISNITKEAVKLTGCSRTDAGVHAKGFVANFFTNSGIPESRFKNAINSQLAKDIVILDSKEVEADFHARYNCIGKTYSYTILNRCEPSAIGRNYIYHFKTQLDIDAMKRGALFLVGKHDFSAFRSTGSSVKTSVRTITQLDIVKDNDKIIIYATADGFLYNMVRIIVGTLLAVGVGKLTPDNMRQILISRDRSKAGIVVPPQGLCLEKVFY